MINEAIPGFCPRPQLGMLEVIAQNIPLNGAIVEVGSLFGRSAYVWLSSSDASVRVYCVDPWDGEEVQAYNGFSMKRGTYLGFIENTIDNFKSNLVGFEKKLVPVRQKSPLSEWRFGPIDVVYLDGDHSYLSVAEDLRFWAPLIKANGILCGDDYADEFSGVIKAVQEGAKILGCQIVKLGKFWIYQTPQNKPCIDLIISCFKSEWLKMGVIRLPEYI